MGLGGWCAADLAGVHSGAAPSAVSTIGAFAAASRPTGRNAVSMWLDSIDVGGRGIVQPAQGPLGRALRAARHDVFLSQQRLADLAGVSQTAVSRLERGAPSWSLFCRLVEALGGRPNVTVERLVTDRELTDLIMRGEALPPDVGADADDWW